jgi:Lon protease-like protein
MKQAIFPLHTILFPGGTLPLQIFEQRYLSLIKDCMKQETGFVTVLISEGKEVGAAPQIYSTGCYVEITDWESLPNGLLGISIQAKYRVRLSACTVRDDGLLMAEATAFESTLESTLESAQQEEGALPEVFTPLADTLKQLMKHPFAERYQEAVDYNNVADICFRLSELLPIGNREKQQLLEAETAQQMLDLLTLHINAMQS